jgi:plasmid stabilization system protein ParE
MNHVHYTPKARRDIDDIAEYIAVDNLDAAIQFCVAVEGALDKLVEMPGMGRLREFSNLALASIRSWPIKGFANYLVSIGPYQMVLKFSASFTALVTLIRSLWTRKEATPCSKMACDRCIPAKF